jgi:hypothetical protein
MPQMRRRLIDRMRDRGISISDLNRLRLWIETCPHVPEGDRLEDFGSFKICGSGSYPKTFLLRGQVAKGEPSDRGTREIFRLTRGGELGQYFRGGVRLKVSIVTFNIAAGTRMFPQSH